MKVPLLDLKLQYKQLKAEIDETLIRVAESQYFILGPEVEKLEKNLCEYLKCEFALGVSSGTDALLIALMAIDIKPDDEVIVPDFSFFATAGVVSRLNAKPIFADIDPITFNLNVDGLEKLVTKKTRAIIPVHLFGQSADMTAIVEFAKKHELIVIEDAAQAIGTQYKDGKYVGTIGDMGCYSFFPSKNLGCFGDGGLVVTNNPELGKKLKMLRVHGMEPKYYHKIIGGNFRIDAIQSAILSVKLPHLDSWSEKRRRNAALYNKLFIEHGLAQDTGSLTFNENNRVLLPKAIYEQFKDIAKNYHIFNQYVIRVEDREGLKKFLIENEIGVEVYYPVPFQNQECFTNLHIDKSLLKNSLRASEHVLALPIFPELQEEQIKFVVQKIKEYLKR